MKKQRKDRRCEQRHGGSVKKGRKKRIGKLEDWKEERRGR